MSCLADPACVFPAGESGLCANHQRDRLDQTSLVGSTLTMMYNVMSYGRRIDAPPKQYGSMKRMQLGLSKGGGKL